MALTDEELRNAASHRWLALAKLRNRKAGAGDYRSSASPTPLVNHCRELALTA